MDIQVRTENLGLSNNLHHGQLRSRGQLLVGFCGNTALGTTIYGKTLQLHLTQCVVDKHLSMNMCHLVRLCKLSLYHCLVQM